MHKQIISCLFSKYVKYLSVEWNFKYLSKRKHFCFAYQVYADILIQVYRIVCLCGQYLLMGHTYKHVIVVFKTGFLYVLLMELLTFLLFASRGSLRKGVNSKTHLHLHVSKTYQKICNLERGCVVL